MAGIVRRKGAALGGPCKQLMAIDVVLRGEPDNRCRHFSLVSRQTGRR